jgi:ABC-type uncharacterized transport system substrate-binding protein
MIEVSDPVGCGIVPSLTRPSKNVAGLANNLYEYALRCLRLLKEVMPGASRLRFPLRRSVLPRKRS